MTLVCDKRVDVGSQLLVDFCKYVESTDSSWLHVFGLSNGHSLKSYKGQVTNDRKEVEMSQFKYCLVSEANA
jgi:hypothetical protein